MAATVAMVATVARATATEAMVARATVDMEATVAGEEFEQSSLFSIDSMYLLPVQVSVSIYVN